jgi:protein-disulfide isomerase
MAISHRVALAPGRPLVRLGSTVASLALALSLGMSTGGMAAAQETAEPELTWAPLVTLPPIAEPPFMTPVGTADGFRLGAADAPVAIEVWEDFQCPFCQRFSFQIKPELVARYVETGQASLTFRQLPFLGGQSHRAAVAASLTA